MSDERQRPQYGEYASPEQQAAAMGTPSPAHATPVVAPPTATPVAPVAPAARVAPAAANRSWDRILTIALLAYGLFNVITGFFQYRDMNAVLDRLYETQGVGDYTPTSLTATLGTVIIITNFVLYLGGAYLASRLVRQGRIAFWAPLAAGAVASIIAGSCLLALMFGDPAFAEYLNSAR